MHGLRTGFLSNYEPNTYGAELVELAVRLGVALSTQDGSDLPSEPTLSRLKTCYRDAATTFANDRSWSWLSPILTVTTSPEGTGPKNVAGDPSVYALGENYRGQPFGVTSSSRRRVSVGVASDIREALAYETATGYVEAVACEERAIASSNQTRPQTVLLVCPAPSTAETLTFRMRIRSPLPNDLADFLPWGSEHNQTVRLGAMLKFVRDGQSGVDTREYQAEYDAAMAQSRRIDAEAHGDGGTLGVPVDSPAGDVYRTWNEPLS